MPFKVPVVLLAKSPLLFLPRPLISIKNTLKAFTNQYFWQFEFPGGAVANCSTSYSAYVDRLYATCESGWFEISPAFNATGTKGRTSKGEMNMPVFPYQQIAQLDDFATAVSKNDTPIASGAEGLKDIKLIEGILRAAETGKRIKLI